MIPRDCIYAESKLDEVLTDFNIKEKASDYSSFKATDEKGASVDAFRNEKGDEIIFGENGELKSIMRINNMVNNQNKVVEARTSKGDFDGFIEELKGKGYIPREFECVSCDLYGQDMWMMFFSDTGNEIINPYDSVKIGFDVVSGEILFYKRIRAFSKELQPSITEDKAVDVANAYLSGNNIDVKGEVEDVQLKVVNLRDYDEDEVVREDNYILVYKIVYSENKYGLAEVLVDSASGEIIRVEYNEAYAGKSFYCLDNTSNSNDKYRKTRATNYNAIMGSLGYNSSVQYLGQTSASRTTIINYLNGSNSWAFTFSGHGNATTIAGHNSAGNTVFSVYHTDVPGVWSFVVLDACKTASASTWANAFGIYDFNNLGRSFLGWSVNITPTKAKTFSNYFKNEMLGYPSRTVLANVYAAIANIPDNEVYNIIYIGDRSTNGHK
jgi:hypothetical protein